MSIYDKSIYATYVPDQPVALPEVVAPEPPATELAPVTPGAPTAPDPSTRTDGNNITVTPGFEARGVVLVSACRAESTADADTSDGEISFGAFTSASARVGTTLFHDGTDSQSAVEYDEAYVHIDTTPALVALGDVSAVGSTTFTMVMDNADDAENFVGYFAIGDNVETSKPWLHYAHLMRS